MAAPKGNQFWKARSSHGRKPKFASPEILLEACEEYFEWVADNPLHEAKAFSYQGETKIEYLPKMRAMTVGGMCLFLDIDKTTWLEYRNKDGFSTVTTRVDEAIRTQKFAGAAADLLNANIIARDLGLADKNEFTGKDGGNIKVEDATPLDHARNIAFLLASAGKDKS